MSVPLTIKVFLDGVLVSSREFELDTITVGRLDSSDLCLNDVRVSRRHCVIEVAADGRLFVADADSTSGTYVNGCRVTRRQVSPEDEIRVGGLILRLECPSVRVGQ